MAQKPISKAAFTCKTDCGVDNRPIVAPTVSKEAYWMGLRYSDRFCSKIIGILGTVGLQKSGYFSVMYVVLWIRVIDAIGRGAIQNW